MSKNIQDLQAQLDEITTQKCKHEWRETIHDIEQKLNKFISDPECATFDEKVIALEVLKQNLYVNSRGRIAFNKPSEVPAPYLVAEKANAVADFITRVERMTRFSIEHNRV